MSLSPPTNGVGGWTAPSESRTYTYGDRIASVGSSFGAIITSQTYKPTGTIAERDFADASGIVEQFGYDPNNNLTGYVLSRATPGSMGERHARGRRQHAGTRA